VIVPGEEDFGLVPVEASAAGRPTVAYGAGGALETVVEGVTGVFFNEPTAASLVQALRGLDPASFDAGAMRAHAESFSVVHFREKLADLLAQWI
jgi:glycosyltransferase involved in cell wall biosynthesis